MQRVARALLLVLTLMSASGCSSGETSGDAASRPKFDPDSALADERRVTPPDELAERFRALRAEVLDGTIRVMLALATSTASPALAQRGRAESSEEVAELTAIRVMFLAELGARAPNGRVARSAADVDFLKDVPVVFLTVSADDLDAMERMPQVLSISASRNLHVRCRSREGACAR